MYFKMMMASLTIDDVLSNFTAQKHFEIHRVSSVTLLTFSILQFNNISNHSTNYTHYMMEVLIYNYLPLSVSIPQPSRMLKYSVSKLRSSDEISPYFLKYSDETGCHLTAAFCKVRTSHHIYINNSSKIILNPSPSPRRILRPEFFIQP